jgi:hypothetical protein
MKNDQITKRIEEIDKKLQDPAQKPVRIDYDSFSEAEKKLFEAVAKIQLQDPQTGNHTLIDENNAYFNKVIEVMYNRIRELYCNTIPTAIAGSTLLELDVINYYFKLHFLNFETDLYECLQNLTRWTEKDQQEFVDDLKKNGTRYFRIPRGFNDHNQLNEKKNSRTALEEEEEQQEKNG